MDVQKTDHTNKQTTKNIYVVLGVPRSGTSAISRGLKALGINLGTRLVTPSQKWNPKGYWEDTDIVHLINEKILNVVSSRWDSIKVIEAEQQNSSAVDSIRRHASELINQRMTAMENWGFKDPRTIKLLPFWQSVFSSLKLTDNYVIALRNPLASAQSYKNLTNIDFEKGLLLWLTHLVAAVDGTKGKTKVMVSYDLLLKNPSMQLERIKKQLALSINTDPKEIDIYANQFLDKKLQHYEFSYEDLHTHQAARAVPLCLKAYDIFMKLAKDEITFDDQAFSSEWSEFKKEFDREYPTFCYIDSLLQRNKIFERMIRTIHRSMPWKIIFPLRIIDNTLRNYRKIWRAKRRLKRVCG
ncbi:MAG: hypothetical protein ABI597_08550 [Gammaproteobacteria bacterium]